MSKADEIAEVIAGLERERRSICGQCMRPQMMMKWCTDYCTDYCVTKKTFEHATVLLGEYLNEQED